MESEDTYSRRRKPSLFKRKGFWRFFLFCMLMLFVGLVGTYFFFKPYKERAEKYDMTLIGEVEQPSLILDRNGREIGRMFVENRSLVSIERVPDRLINALIAQEDQRFWEHEGVDWIGAGRAIYGALKSGEASSGASTLTMQLARNAFYLKEEALKLGENGLERKIVESFVALRIEDYHSGDKGKRKILEFYLNRVPFGHNYHGVRAASLGYFGKEPRDLTLEECASLVSCVKNPVAISPLRHPETNQKARNHVFLRMMKEGDLTEEEYNRLVKLPVKTNPKPLYQQKSYIYEKIAKLARKNLGDEAVSRGGFRIYTTIDRDIQNAVQDSIEVHLSEIENHEEFAHPLYEDYERKEGKAPEYLQGAALVMDSQNGSVLAHVGGRDYAHNQFDFIEGGARPLGTAFFPFLYTAAFEQGHNPAVQIKDEPMNAKYLGIGGGEGIVGEWGMEVNDPSYEERMIMAREAFRDSKIAASARLGRLVGLEKIAETAKNFGMELERTKKDKLLARQMLGWDPVSVPVAVKAISAFSTGGKGPAILRYIDRIEDVDGNVVYRITDSAMARKKVQYCSEEAAYQTHSMLAEVATKGNLADRSGALPRGFRGGIKTGTLDNFSDGWALGYNGKIACGIWVGFRDGNNEAIYPGAFAKDLSLPIFANAIEVAQQSFPAKDIEVPASIVPISTCSRSGHKSTPYCYEIVEVEDEYGQAEARSQSTEYTEFFRRGKEIETLCHIHGQKVGDNRYLPNSSDQSTKDLSHIPPIRAKGMVILGSDPYGAELPTLVPPGEEQPLRIHDTIELLSDEETVKRQVTAEKEATLQLVPPERMIIRGK